MAFRGSRHNNSRLDGRRSSQFSVPLAFGGWAWALALAAASGLEFPPLPREESQPEPHEADSASPVFSGDPLDLVSGQGNLLTSRIQQAGSHGVYGEGYSPSSLCCGPESSDP